MKSIRNIIASLVLTLTYATAYCQEEVSNEPEVITDYSTVFWVLVVMGVFLFIANLTLAQSIKLFAGSKSLTNKITKNADKAGLILLLLLPASALAEGPGSVQEWLVSEGDVWFIAIIDLVLFFGYLFLNRLYRNLLEAGMPKVEKKVVEEPSSSFVTRVLTQTVPIEEEEEILMDHEYDGIRELDNRLPPWWLWGFYISIGVAVVYMLHFHVFGTGDLQLAEYQAQIEAGEAQKAEYLSKLALNVDETNVAYLTDSKTMNAGKSVYVKHCQVCHADKGQGQVGPNFTDDYWIYGNTPTQVFSTIKYGAKRGMKSWEKDLNPIEMQQVTSFIISLQNTEVEGGKEQEGDFYAPYDPSMDKEEVSPEVEPAAEDPEATS